MASSGADPGPAGAAPAPDTARRTIPRMLWFVTGGMGPPPTWERLGAMVAAREAAHTRRRERKANAEAERRARKAEKAGRAAVDRARADLDRAEKAFRYRFGPVGVTDALLVGRSGGRSNRGGAGEEQSGQQSREEPQGGTGEKGGEAGGGEDGGPAGGGGPGGGDGGEGTGEDQD